MTPQSPPAYGPDLIDLCKTGSIGGLTDRELLDRYTALDDTAATRAFEVIVRRHGPMVLGVCRRALADEHAAEDAFQAAFLALALKARQIRNRDSLGAWLHAVALRVSRRARATRRHRAESPLASTAIEAASSGGDPIEAAELRSSLDEEIDRLPTAYRRAVILCYFQGKTQDDAARELGWTKGTVSGRLARAKDLLRGRLARRGLAPSAALTAASLPAADASPAIPAGLLDVTVRAAIGLALGRQAMPAGAGPAIELAGAALRSMLLSRVKTVAAAILLTTAATVAMARAGALLDPPPREPLAASGKATSPPSKPLTGPRLPRHAIARLGATQLRHDSFVTGVAFAPDGRTLASSSWDGSVRFWDPATGETSATSPTIRGDESGFLSIAYSPDGSKLATGSANGWVHLRDLTANRDILSEKVHTGRVYGLALAFAPDGRTFATAGSEAPVVTIRDAETGRERRRLTVQEKDSYPGQIIFSRDGKRLAACITPRSSGNDRIVIWNLDAEQTPVIIHRAHDAMLGSLAFAPDGSLISCGMAREANTPAFRPQIRIWNTATGQRLREYDPGIGHGAGAVILSPDGRDLISVHSDCILLWDLATGTIRRTLPGGFDNRYPPRIAGIAISPDGKRLAAERHDHAVHLWDLETGEPRLLRKDAHDTPIRATCLLGESLVAAGDDLGRIAIWDLSRGERTRTLELGELGRVGRVWSIRLAPDGRSLAAVGDGPNPDCGTRGVLRVWDVRDFTSRHETLLEHRAFCVAFSGDSRHIAVGCGELDGWRPNAIVAGWESRVGEIQVLDMTTGQKQASLPVPQGRICTLAFTRDGQTLVSGTEDSVVRFWDISSSRQAREMAVQGPPSDNQGVAQRPRATLDGAAFSPDLATVATAAPVDDKILVWGLSNGQVRRTISVPAYGQIVLAFSPEGRRLASAIQPSGPESPSARISIWDVATKRELLRLEPGTGGVASLAFSADGKRLVSGQDDTTAIVWDVSSAIEDAGRPGN